jgi:uncharacterized protein (TIGR02145 family)/uncharacterized repeat protein (TIGR02543 family)
MKRGILIGITLSLIFPFIICEYSGNKYDPNNPDYQKPSCRVDTIRSTVKLNDTIGDDTASIILIGLDKDFNTRFQWKLDTFGWSAWTKDTDGGTRIPLSGLAPGPHTVKVASCYDEKSTISESELLFYRADPPHIIAMSDTPLDVDAGDSCILWAKGAGTGTLKYKWCRDTLTDESTEGDSLVLHNVSIADTVKPWYCRISSKWGNTISSALHIRLFFRVRYNGNENTGGEVPVDTNRYQTGDKPDVAGNTGNLMRRGYTFDGWNDKKDGSGLSLDSSRALKIRNENVTLYAKWTANQYTVTFYKNDTAATGTMTVQSIVFGASANLIANGFAKKNYHFNGWATSPAGVKAYNDKASYTMKTEGVTLYAKWEPDVYTITYQLNEGTNGNNPATYTIESATISLTEAVRKSYVFDGWYTDSIFMTKIIVISKGSTGNRKLWAKWVIKDADGNIYSEVKIGNQVWMKENLKTAKYNDETQIPFKPDSTEWIALSTPGYCWYANNTANKASYGALYNWYTMATGKLAPKGWHVPSKTEWDTLTYYLGGRSFAVEKLRGTAQTGFSVLGGRRSDGGKYDDINKHGDWWATDIINGSTWNFGMDTTKLWSPPSGGNNRKFGFSVRCIRD